MAQKYSEDGEFLVEKKKYYIVAGLVLMLLAAGWILFSGTGADNNNISDTIQRIGDNNARTGQEVDNARQQVAGAAANAAGTLERIERSQTIAEQNTGTIAECRELVKQCQYDNSRAERILQEIEQRNKETASTGKEKSN